MVYMRILVPLLFLVTLVHADRKQAAAAAVNRAIEQTKSRQSPAQAPARTVNNKNAAQSPGRTESIDVDRLNKLIRALDKTWVMPRAGAKEPVGSNFQYKKTCSSIFKARHGACQQLGFGVMCFNYCHERGEKLAFRCQDASDAAYCRQSGTFETFIAKYRKDSYKAKAYVHQMLSRCYATAICNTQTGMLNASIIDEEADEVTERTTRLNRLKLLTRPPQRASTLPPDENEPSITVAPEEVEQTTTTTTSTTTTTPSTTTTTKKLSIMEKKRASPRPKLRGTPAPATPATTTSANIWDKFTIGNKGKPTPKYIPFWQRLMSTTTAPKTEEVTEKSLEIEETTMDLPEEPETTVPEDEDGAGEVDEDDDEEEEEEITTTTVTKKPVTKRPKSKKAKKVVVEQKNPAEKHTFRPLPMTTPPPPGPELAFQKPGEQHTDQEPGFWNRFQPNRWYQSIHYVTNTGK